MDVHEIYPSVNVDILVRSTIDHHSMIERNTLAAVRDGWSSSIFRPCRDKILSMPRQLQPYTMGIVLCFCDADPITSLCN
jgi:hypothetical protein